MKYLNSEFPHLSSSARFQNALTYNAMADFTSFAYVQYAYALCSPEMEHSMVTKQKLNAASVLLCFLHKAILLRLKYFLHGLACIS